MKFTAFHLFCGLGGGALGFQRARFAGSSFRTLGGVDNDAAACRDFEQLTGVAATCADVATMTVDELRAAARGEAPDVIVTSPPCKGFSGLLPSARLAETKYQTLNHLVFQGLWLALEAWADAPPKLIVLENVPRIRQRGAELLHQLRGLLARYGYRTVDTLHDCGEIGGLAQHRRRFLLVARHEAQVPTYLYEPPKRRVRGIGEILGELPMPDDPAGGPMHRLPRLQWKTWVRLALIPAGGDWRALGTKSDGPWRGTYGIVPWGQPGATVTGNGRPGAGAFSVADPRLQNSKDNRNGDMEACPALGFDLRSQHQGTREESDEKSQMQRRLQDDARQNPEANNAGIPSGWSLAEDVIAPSGDTHSRAGGVRGDASSWDGGETSKRQPSGLQVSQSAMVNAEREHCGQVETRNSDSRGEAAQGTADREPGTGNQSVVRVEHSVGTGIRSSCGDDPSGEARKDLETRLSISRTAFNNVYRVVRWEEPSVAVTSGGTPTSCGVCVADPRIGGNGSRPDLLGVLRWDHPAKTVSGHASVSGSNCPAAVADPRIPTDSDRPDPPPVILAEDGTWHRPLTTLELAAIQGLPVPLELDGASHAKWRERIGNCVPPPAAQAIAEEMLRTLAAAGDGATFTLGSTDVWVDEVRP